MSAASIKDAKTISSAFDPHMKIFVDAQDKYGLISFSVLILQHSFILAPRALSDMISAYRGPKARTSLDETSVGEDSVPHVLPSSTELFYFYGQTLEQCARFSNKAPLFDLSTVHKKWLRIYAGKLAVLDLDLLQTWSYMILMIWFPEDVLVAGLKRLVILRYHVRDTYVVILLTLLFAATIYQGSPLKDGSTLQRSEIYAYF